MQGTTAALAMLIRFDRWLLRVETVLVVIMFPALVTVTFLQVVFRYILNRPLIWTEELSINLFIWVAFIGSAIAVAEKGHYGLELLKNRLPSALRLAADIAICVISAAFLLIVIVYGLEVVVVTSHTMTTLPLSMRWFFSAVPVGATLMLLHLGIIFGKTILAREQ